MAQLLMQGTNYLNFIGRYCWVAAGEHGLTAVRGDRARRAAGGDRQPRCTAWPSREDYRKHLEHGRRLENAHEHPGKDISDQLLHPLQKPEVLAVQDRGEYLYAACGEGGVRVFDIAFIDDKGFSERITTAPVSPLGQKFYVRTKYATAVAAPTTIGPRPDADPLRREPRGRRSTRCTATSTSTDKYEGLILVGAGTMLDGNPLNNFLKRELTFNPDGLLSGANAITIVGTYAYICCDAGLVVVALGRPEEAGGDGGARRPTAEASARGGRSSSATPTSATTRASRCWT